MRPKKRKRKERFESPVRTGSTLHIEVSGECQTWVLCRNPAEHEPCLACAAGDGASLIGVIADDRRWESG
jgi:hypothetical protein